MARSERQVPPVYFGRPGALVQMPWPVGGITKPYERLTADYLTGSGQHAVTLSPSGSRAFTVSWNALHIDNYSKISQYWMNGMGIGPWALVDPSAPNLLLPNQAAATNALYDTTGFSTNAGTLAEGTILSNTASANIHRTGALRSIRWQFTTAAGSLPTLRCDPPYRNWFGIPAVPGLSYTWSVWAKPDGVVDSSITMAAKIQWFDIAGASISDSTSGDIVMTGWTNVKCTATAPAGTAYAKPVCIALGSTITTGASIYLDELNFEQDSVGNAWAPGVGCRPVEILGLNEVTPFEARFRTDAALTLREVAV